MKKRTKQKKAEGKEMSFLIFLIILLASAAVMLMFLYQINKVSDEQTDIAICRKSVDLVSAANIEGLNSNALNCPTTYLDIRYDDNERIKKVLADNMANCWYKFGEGRKEIFSKTYWKKDKNYCAICSVIRFDKDAKKRKITNFLEYLKNKKVRRAYCNKEDIRKNKFHDCSYFGYILPYSTQESIDVMYTKFSMDKNRGKVNDIIDTDNDYATVLIYSKHSYFNKKESSLIGLYTGTGIATALVMFPEPVVSKAAAGVVMLGGLIGTGTGYALGSEKDSDWKAGIALVPYSEKSLEALNCEELPINQHRKDTMVKNKKQVIK